MTAETVAPRKVALGPWVMRLVLLAVGVAVLVGGLSYGVRTPEGLVGAGMMPFAAGLLMVAFGAWECFTGFRAERNAAAESETAEAESAEEAGVLDVFGRSAAQRNRAVALVFGVILGAVVLAYVIGLLLALSVMVFVLLSVIEKKPVWTGLVGAVAAFAFGYLVFGMALNVPLATGMLGLV